MLRPIRHWADSKTRCHIFTCLTAVKLLRIIELRLRNAGVNMTAHMQKLHSCLWWLPDRRKTVRTLKEPTDEQGKIIQAFGWKIAGGVLQET